LPFKKYIKAVSLYSDIVTSVIKKQLMLHRSVFEAIFERLRKLSGTHIKEQADVLFKLQHDLCELAALLLAQHVGKVQKFAEAYRHSEFFLEVFSFTRIQLESKRFEEFLRKDVKLLTEFEPDETLSND